MFIYVNLTLTANFNLRVMETVKAIRDQGHLELVYLGRKRLANASEPYLTGTDQLVQVDYSYWTLSYYINRRGAQKLIDGEPLSKIVPVDEYIPIMFDRFVAYLLLDLTNKYIPK